MSSIVSTCADAARSTRVVRDGDHSDRRLLEPFGTRGARIRDFGGGRTSLPSTVGFVHDHLPPGLPPDPFAGDPADPAAALDSPDPAPPLDAHERLAVEEDLADLAVYEALLGHHGIRGLVISCEDCHDDHFHDWEMLRANLMQLLVDGSVRPHEPAFDPIPEDYVTWDYCRGYADAAMNDASLFTDGFDA